jgi:hypothetical protein
VVGDFPWETIFVLVEISLDSTPSLIKYAFISFARFWASERTNSSDTPGNLPAVAWISKVAAEPDFFTSFFNFALALELKL